MRRRLLGAVCALALLTAAPARADPISASILTAIGVSGAATAATATAVAVAATTTFTILTTVLTFALTTAASFALTALLGPKQKAQERQASVTSVSLGEVPREMVVGRACTGGSLVDAAYWGGKYNDDWNGFIFAVADHGCDALEGYYLDDQYYTWAASGLQPGFSNALDMEWLDGFANPVPPSRFASYFGLTDDDRLAGVAHIYVAYKFDEKVWPQGRPRFRFVLRGARVYDPRLDDTILGGAGAQRADQPATWTWSENAELCRYAYDRGVYAEGRVSEPSQLLVGRGLTLIEAPPAAIIPAANLCDEAVDLAAGGTEPRYRVGGVIRADEEFSSVEEMFAAAMGGVIVQHEGGVGVEPGHGKSPVVTITDGDLVSGTDVQFSAFLPDTQRINTVSPRYIEPTQGWSDHAAPVRRMLSDLVADGGSRESPLTLSLVTSGTQAQRCGEITRRLGRLERRGSLTLGPRFSGLEEGDWIAWQSDRHHAGATVLYRIESWGLAETWRTVLSLREVASSAFGWVAATDEYTPGSAPPVEAEASGPLELDAVTAEGVDLSGVPAIRMHWATTGLEAVAQVRMEVRRAGEADATPTMTDRVTAGVMVSSAGVAPGTAMQARLTPLGDPSRKVTPSPWIDLTMDHLVAAYLGDVSAAEVASTVTAVSGGLSGIDPTAAATLAAVSASGGSGAMTKQVTASGNVTSATHTVIASLTLSAVPASSIVTLMGADLDGGTLSFGTTFAAGWELVAIDAASTVQVLASGTLTGTKPSGDPLELNPTSLYLGSPTLLTVSGNLTLAVRLWRTGGSNSLNGVSATLIATVTPQAS